MAAPSFIAEAETAWNTDTSPKTTGNLTVETNDILVAVGITETWFTPSSPTLTISDNQTPDLTWTNQETIAITDYCSVYIWTASSNFAGTLTVTFTKATGAVWFGGNVLQFRSSDGIGAAEKENAATGEADVAITTTQADSAIVVAIGDWNAVDGATRAYNTATAGAFTEQSYFRDSVHYTLYVGYHAGAGAIGAKTVGLTDPNGTKYAIAAVEVKGTAAAASLPRPPLVVSQAVNRASTY